MGTKRRIGHRDIAKLELGEVLWDTIVTGFGVRRQKSDAVSYVLFYRTQEGRQRWHTIGRHGAPWVPDTARDEARRLLGAVAGGEDPATAKQARRQAVTVAELCDAYLSDCRSGRVLTRRKQAKKASTLATDASRIERHIKPRLGALPAAGVTADDIEKFVHAVGDDGGGASRTTGLLGAVFAFAMRRRMRPDNPVRGVARPADGRRDRRLSEEEYAQLGAGLRASTGVWPFAVAAMRFVALTGFRRGEVLNLRWDEVDLARRVATLSDSKTGRSARPLSRLACDVLRGLDRMHGTPLVFPGRKGRAMSGNAIQKQWRRVTALSGIPPAVTPHTLRHSFASLAGDLGLGDSTIAALLGHVGRSMTSRYVHLGDRTLLAAADAVANHTARLMGDGPVEISAETRVIPLRA
jgi:integrase